MERLVQPTATSVALALLAFAVISAPAGAHQCETSQGNDFALTATDHRSGSVCDMERDGAAVTAEWYDAEGISVALEWDGGDSGCDEGKFRGKAVSVVVCEDNLQNPYPCTYSGEIKRLSTSLLPRN